MLTFEKLQNISVGNSACMVKTPHDAHQACRNAITTEFTVGTITAEKKDGNVGKTYFYDSEEKLSVNALGLPNLGMERMSQRLSGRNPASSKSMLSAMAEIALLHKKKFCVSVAGDTPHETAELARIAYEEGAHIVEVNAGCGNRWTGSVQKAIPSYHPAIMSEIFEQILIKKLPKVRLKVSPLESPLLEEVTDVIVTAEGVVECVVGVNTWPNYRKVDENGKAVLSFTDGVSDHVIEVGGLAGKPLNPHMKRVCKYLLETLPKSIDVVAVGGIFEAADVADVLEWGASGFQCGTAFIETQGKVFQEVMSGLLEMCKEDA